jgi:MoxR-like ATPase
VHVSVEDIEALALPVLRHRIVPTFAAEAEGLDADGLVSKILAAVPRGAATHRS